MLAEQAEVARWIRKAGHDWSAARKVFGPDCVELDIVAFHCQQAVEKLLKGYLASRRIEFEKVHDLGYLLDHCATADPELETLRDEVEPLTAYAVIFRYPGPAEPTRTEVEAALATVERVWDFVTKRLPPDVLPA
jgi:HEPN domain-containing protein